MPNRFNMKKILPVLTLCLMLAAMVLPTFAQDETAEATDESTSEPVATWTAAPTEEATEESTSEPVATWTAAPTEEATDEATSEATVEATEEATAEVTLEATEEVTAEATAEAAAVEATATPTPEAAPTEPVTGLSTLMLLVGLGAVAAVGGITWMRQRNENSDK